jgi:predicted Zn-dependent protease
MRFILIVWLLVLGVLPLSAQQIEPPISAELLTELTQTLSNAANQEGGRALFDQAILLEGNTDSLLAEIKTRLDQEQLSTANRIATLRLQTAILQRRGDLQAALASVEQELELHTELDSIIQHAQLLDCLERREDALNAYAQALELLPKEDERVVTLLLRRAMLSMEGDEEAKDSLAEFAASDACDLNMRNRAAVVLALLGRPEDAIELYEVEGEGSQLFRSQIRMAEWALKAKDADAAQKWAWLARASATLTRDRYYALTVLTEAHRMDDSLDRLLQAYAGEEDMDQQSHAAWIALLRETGDYDDAVTLYENSNSASGFSNASRRELLEMYREAGRTEEMVQQYKLLMATEPNHALWPEGLSRFYLEQGNTEEARGLWTYFLEDAPPGLGLVEAAKALMGLGQDDLAELCAQRCVDSDTARFAALQFLFDMHRLRGELDLAAAVLERTDQLAAADSPVRMQLSESFERIGNLQRAVDVLEQLREARGEELSEDLEMRLAWLHSEVGNEDIALERWRNLWLRVDSIPRRRYVEDRMMAVASRLGKLADIAIELEGRLFSGHADKRDSGLLVRLYTQVGDPVSATEIIEEFLKQAGGSAIEALEEKARVYMSCTDYHHYESTIRHLITLNPEGEGEYLQQIAMSMLERGKPDQARTVLERLKEIESDVASAEFEAGVLALAGMREEAITAYQRGLANNPDRIESYLMMAALMEQVGEKERAIGMFQDIALNADRDDLFMIAIDGLLNLDAPNGIMSWARRITLERLARRHDQVYLYQLLADIAEQVNDTEARIAALQGSLAIAGDRRVSVVRELMDLSAGRNNSFSFVGNQSGNAAKERHLAFGRRLIGLGQLVPPQVYLDLGRTFLAGGAISDASKTFRLARDLPDYDVFQREVGSIFEQSGYLHQALDIYRKVLIGDSTNVGLLVKVGELQEQLGDDVGAARLYRRAVELLLARRPLVTGDKDGESTQKYSRWGARNVDDFDKFFERSANGLLVTFPQAEIAELLAAQESLVSAEIAAAAQLQNAEKPLPLNRYPRLFRRSLFVRRMALSYGQPQFAATMDQQLLRAFPQDDVALGMMVRERVQWGLTAAAHALLLDSGREPQEIESLLWLVGKGVAANATELVPIDEALRLLLPMMAAKQYEDARLLLRRVDFGGIKADRNKDAGVLFAASALIGDQDLSLFLGRNWLRLLISADNSANAYVVRPVLARVALSLQEDFRRSFYQYFVQLILDDTDKHGSLLSLLPSIQKQVAEPLMEQEKLVELITANPQSFAYNLGPLLQLATEDARAGLASAVWNEISPTTRLWFLFNLMEAEVGPLGSEVEDLLVEWFEQLLGDEEDLSRLNYRLDQLTTDEAMVSNPSLSRRIVAVLVQAKPDAVIGKFAQIKLLMHDQHNDEAITLALEVFFLPEVQDEENWEFYQTRYYIQETILPLAPEKFLAKMDSEEQGKTPDLDGVNRRLNLIRQLSNKDLTLQELRKACEQLPNELSLLQQLYSALRNVGNLAEADALMAKMVAQFPSDADLAALEFRIWLEQSYDVKALEALHRLQKIRGEVNQATAEEDAAQKVATADIAAVKAAVDQQDYALASNLLRRMWRTFSNATERFFFSGNPFWTQLRWPQDIQDDEQLSSAELAVREADQARRERSGLDAYREPEPHPETQPNAWEVLAKYPFGVAEMERFFRSNGPQNLENYTAIIDGLALARTLQNGPDQAIAQLLAKVNSGNAVKVEVLQLLSLLQSNPDFVGPEAQQALDELTSSLHPRDGNQLLRLANVMVAAGARDRALDLYRWCATQTSASDYFSNREEEFGSIPVSRLVAEMRASLVTGDDMIAIIEMALQFSTPGDSPWEQASYQRLVLDTWVGLLEPAEALAHSREICAGADRILEYRWNNFSDTAAWLYAHQNELDRALECLNFFLDGQQGQSLRQNMYPRLFPEDGSKWVDYPAWLRRIGPALLQWIRDEKLSPGDGLRAAALVVVRLFEQGELEQAQLLLDGIREFPFESGETSLWIADAARRIGNSELADSIELDLFERESLNDWRVHALLTRMAALGQVETVLAYGEKMAERRRPMLVMELMRTVATTAGDTHSAEVWAARIDDAKRAREEIELYQMAEAEKNGNTTMMRIR